MTKDDDKEKGLYGKYIIIRRGDIVGKHNDCWFYVLDLKHDKFAAPALLEYARLCEQEYPLLAADIRKKVKEGK